MAGTSATQSAIIAAAIFVFMLFPPNDASLNSCIFIRGLYGSRAPGIFVPVIRRRLSSGCHAFFPAAFAAFSFFLIRIACFAA